MASCKITQKLIKKEFNVVYLKLWLMQYYYIINDLDGRTSNILSSRSVEYHISGLTPKGQTLMVLLSEILL